MATSSLGPAGLSSLDTALLTNVLNEAVFTAQEKSIAGSLFRVYDYSRGGIEMLVVNTFYLPNYVSLTNRFRVDA